MTQESLMGYMGSGPAQTLMASPLYGSWSLQRHGGIKWPTSFCSVIFADSSEMALWWSEPDRVAFQTTMSHIPTAALFWYLGLKNKYYDLSVKLVFIGDCRNQCAPKDLYGHEPTSHHSFCGSHWGVFLSLSLFAGFRPRMCSFVPVHTSESRCVLWLCPPLCLLNSLSICMKIKSDHG